MEARIQQLEAIIQDLQNQIEILTREKEQTENKYNVKNLDIHVAMDRDLTDDDLVNFSLIELRVLRNNIKARVYVYKTKTQDELNVRILNQLIRNGDFVDSKTIGPDGLRLTNKSTRRYRVGGELVKKQVASNPSPPKKRGRPTLIEQYKKQQLQQQQQMISA